MTVKQVTRNFAVADQLTRDDVDQLSQQGIRSIICNRPDGELPGQPAYEEIAAAARAHDIRMVNIPVVGGRLSSEDVQSFGMALDDLPDPLVAYCRSGTRSITLWALDQGARGTPVEEIIAAGRQAGYDLSEIRQMIGTQN